MQRQIKLKYNSHDQMCAAASSPGRARDLHGKTAMEIRLPVPIILDVLHTDTMQPGGIGGGGGQDKDFSYCEALS